MKTYTSLSEAITDLSKNGYTANFSIKNNYIECTEHNINLQPDEFEIDEVHRFQEMSDVDDESVLYAVSSTKHDIKGLLVNAFSIYADEDSAELVAKLSQHIN